MGYVLNFRVIWDNADLLLSGLGLGLFLAVASIAIGCVIGLVAAFASLSRNPVVRGLASAYVTFFRNLPILVIILFAYFALPQLGVALDRIPSFIASLAVYSGAYLTEVFRGGLLAIPKGVIEGGMSIGLRPMQTRRYIIFPLMMRNALPSLGNNFISLFKDTSLAAAISIPELTFYARQINVESFRVVEAWLAASVLYIAACYGIAFMLRIAERRYAISE